MKRKIRNNEVRYQDYQSLDIFIVLIVTMITPVTASRVVRNIHSAINISFCWISGSFILIAVGITNQCLPSVPQCKLPNVNCALWYVNTICQGCWYNTGIVKLVVYLINQLLNTRHGVMNECVLLPLRTSETDQMIPG